MGGPVGHFSGSLPLVDLPAGLSTRPLQLDDARAVFEVMAAQELDDIGEVMIEEADIVGDWSRPVVRRRRLAPSASSTATGWWRYGEVGPSDRGDAAVHPDYRGRGIGTALARWMQDNARGSGSPRSACRCRQGSPGDRLLEALGYHVRWSSWVLELPRGRDGPGPRRCPRGTPSARPTRRSTAQAWTVQEDAFLEWSDRDRAAVRGLEGRDDSGGPASSRGTCAWWSTRPAPWSRWPGCSSVRRRGVHRPARDHEGPARPRTRPGAARRRVRGRHARTAPSGPSCPPTPGPARCRPLREGRHGRHLDVGEPRDRGLSGWTSTCRPATPLGR